MFYWITSQSGGTDVTRSPSRNAQHERTHAARAWIYNP